MNIITLTVDGRPRELQADYLQPGALEYWQAWLAHQARLAHNPLVEFAAKVQALPPDLQAVATQEFMADLDWDLVPKVVMFEVARSLPAVKLLCVLVTGQDVVAAENAAAAFPLLFPWIKRQEYVAGSLEEANRLRAEVGKPPLGQGSGVGVQGSDQPPQGG